MLLATTLTSGVRATSMSLLRLPVRDDSLLPGGVMANKLVYASTEQSEIDEERLGNIRPVGVN